MTETEKGDSQKDNKPKNQLVEGMRKSKATGANPGHSAQHGHGGRAATRHRSSGHEAEDDYQVGGLRWPD
jgi:hypothetical protein